MYYVYSNLADGNSYTEKSRIFLLIIPCKHTRGMCVRSDIICAHLSLRDAFNRCSACNICLKHFVTYTHKRFLQTRKSYEKHYLRIFRVDSQFPRHNFHVHLSSFKVWYSAQYFGRKLFRLATSVSLVWVDVIIDWQPLNIGDGRRRRPGFEIKNDGSESRRHTRRMVQDL